MTPRLDASSRIMYEEAQSRGIDCTTFGDNLTILMKKNDKSWYTLAARTSLQSSVGRSISNNKALTKKILNHFSLPTAKYVLVNKLSDIWQLTSLQFPVVMKPVEGAHGRNVIVGVASIEEARELYRKSDQPILFEEMLQGDEYRIVCVNYEFVAAAFRKQAHVVGDGQHTIIELIEEKNQHPWRGSGHENYLTKIVVNDLVINNIHEQGLALSSIPEAGQEVVLRKTINLSTGGEAWDVSAEVCPENKALFTEIARACDLNVIGIDVMCQSLATPIVEQPRAGVIEVNGSPGLRMHHYPIKGEVRNVAGKILDMVEERLGTNT